MGDLTVIQPYLNCGLCNRLRVIFYFYAQLEPFESLEVVWRWSKKGTPGEFEDVFEPLPKVSFTKQPSNIVKYRGHGFDLADRDQIIDYTDLVLRPDTEALVREQTEMLGDYIAIHVRRTDIEELYKNKHVPYDPDDYSKWYEFIDKHPGKNLYIATDNAASFETIASRYRDSRLINQPYFLTTVERRKTTMVQAVIDLFACIQSDEFLGSYLSSFSEFIQQNRVN